MPRMGLIVVVKGQERGAPKYRCECCPERVVFYDGEERLYERHVIACSQRHDAELRGESLRVKVPGIFDPFVSGDVEYGIWVRANAQAIIDGRTRM